MVAHVLSRPAWPVWLCLTMTIFGGGGCATQLGYHMETKKGQPQRTLIKTGTPEKIQARVARMPDNNDRTMTVELTQSLPETWKETTPVELTRVNTYRPYSLGFKLLDTFFIPLCFIPNTPLFACDLLSRLAGGGGTCWVYDETEPSYFTRLSQTAIITYINPFQNTVSGIAGAHMSDTLQETSREVLQHTTEDSVTNIVSIRALPDCVVKATTSGTLPPLSAKTDPNGNAVISFAAWETFLVPGTTVVIALSANYKDLNSQTALSCESANLMSDAAIAQWQSRELDKRRSQAGLALAKRRDGFTEACSASKTAGADVFLPEKYATLTTAWQSLNQRAAGDNPPAPASVEQEAQTLTATAKALAGEAQIIRNNMNEEMNNLLPMASEALQKATDDKAAIYAPDEYGAARKLIERARASAAKQSQLTPQELQATVQGLRKSLDSIRNADLKAQQALARVTPPQAQSVAAVNSGGLFNRRQLALVIGINEYKAFPRLRNAVSDARAVADVLKGAYGFADVRTLFDNEATAKGMLLAFKQLIQGLRGNEDILIYFAGHGSMDATLGRGYWVPADATDENDYLSNSDVLDFVRAMDVRKAAHVLVVADSCFSGSLIEDITDTRGMDVRPTGETAEAWLARVVQKPSRYVISSGAYDERVPDQSGQRDHSIFADCLLNELRHPETPTFTESELAVRMRRLVAADSDQSPAIGPMKNAGHRGGEFVFMFRSGLE